MLIVVNTNNGHKIMVMFGFVNNIYYQSNETGLTLVLGSTSGSASTLANTSHNIIPYENTSA